MQAKLSSYVSIRLCACALRNHKPVLLVYTSCSKDAQKPDTAPDQTTSHLNVYQEDVPCESAAKCRLLQKATVPHQDAKGPT